MVNKTILHYKIVKKIGQGGMGTVYKAEDTKLGRFVAVKFISSTMLGDERGIKRFEREARAAAALSHPNIAHIYAIEKTDEHLFLVMEYIDGFSLQEKLKAPLPLKTAINYAIQIAEGLYAAHEKGIVHRDIKSSNILVTANGRVKITDFGLAKLVRRSKMTKTNSTMGTAPYMSPEQSRGEDVDHRTDIWSFGIVLYEMIAGRLPFKSDFDSALVYAIQLEEPPALTSLRTDVPIALEKVVNKMLSKDRETRYQHIDEVPVDLNAIDLGSSNYLDVMQRPWKANKRTAPKRMFLIMLIILAFSIPLAFVAGRLFKSQPSPIPKTVARFNIYTVKPDEHLLPYGLAISPDGTTLVYGLSSNGINQLYQRRIDQIEATPIQGTEGVEKWPFFSPDGRELCFWLNNTLQTVSIDGKQLPRVLCELDAYYGGVWTHDNSIIFISQGFNRVSASGGEPEYMFKPDTTIFNPDSNMMITNPELLPNEKFLLFDNRHGIYIHDFDKKMTRKLIENGRSPHYSPRGYIIFDRQGELLAAPFDLEHVKITGEVISFKDDVYLDSFVFSANGTLLYIGKARTKDRMQSLVLVDRNGRESKLSAIQREYAHPRFSPDGESIVFSSSMTTIMLHDVKRDAQRLIISAQAIWGSFNPAWTPDGKWISYCASTPDSSFGIYIKRADGTGRARRIVENKFPKYGDSWSGDGTLFTFAEFHAEGDDEDIWVYSTQSDSAFPFIVTPSDERTPVFSPDGKWIAYTSNRSGRRDVYITPYPGPGQAELVSTRGGVAPVWAPSGRELFYREGVKMMAVQVQTEPVLRLGTPELMFVSPYVHNNYDWLREFDVHPDGQHFLMQKGVNPILVRLNVVFNWFEELESAFVEAQN